MWKIVARGIRETLERRACRTNVYSQSSQDNAKNEVRTSLTCQYRFLAPAFHPFDKGYCGSAKSTDVKGKERDDKFDSNYSWLEAFGWSSILAAGWVVCQSLSLNRRIFDKDTKEKKHKLTDYAGLSNVLRQITNLELKHIFPVTNCISDGKNEIQKSESNWNTSKQFGPITSEEAFDKAIDEFSNIHKIVIGEFELRYGVEALKERRYRDAWMHFVRGAKQSSAASMFNLGLCYELGIGTLADQKKAIKYYNGAAAYDHANALYNLGVFHAQGRGGLPVDTNIARAYFTRAAKLGHAQAQHALNLEKSTARPEETNDISVVAKTTPRDTSLETNTAKETRDKSVDYTLNASVVDKFARDETKDPTRMFLEFLGFKKPNPTPVLVTNDNFCVPCQ